MPETMTRAEHLVWCKQRAREAYQWAKRSNADALRDGVASMLSDLRKHEAFDRGYLEVAMAASTTVKDEASLFAFIDGFN